MREKIFFKNILPIFMVFINIALSVSVVFLMRYVQNLLNSDVKINLVEIVIPEQGRHHQQVDDERQLAGYHRKQTFR